jgi:hypothetical protein
MIDHKLSFFSFVWDNHRVVNTRDDLYEYSMNSKLEMIRHACRSLEIKRLNRSYWPCFSRWCVDGDLFNSREKTDEVIFTFFFSDVMIWLNIIFFISSEDQYCNCISIYWHSLENWLVINLNIGNYSWHFISFFLSILKRERDNHNFIRSLFFAWIMYSSLLVRFASSSLSVP